MIRNKRQATAQQLWRDVARGRGCLQAATGFGKTRVAINIIKSMNDKLPYETCDVVVPSNHLKKDWERREEGHIDKHNLKNVEVFTIHTYIKKHRNPYLLVIDEIHNLGADTFSTVFEICDYTYLLGLTATLERTDGKHELIQRYAPVFDTVTLQECIDNKWVSDYEVYNIGVELSEKDKLKEQEVTDAFNNYFAKLENDFDLANECRGSMKPRWNPIQKEWVEPPQVKLARRKGWKGNSLQQAVAIHKQQKMTNSKGRVWGGNKEFEFSPEKISEYAQKWGFYMNERQEFLHDAEYKKDLAVEIIERFPDKKFIVFTERQVTCDEITDRLKKKGIKCESYHSNINTEIYALGKLVAVGEKVDNITKYRDTKTNQLLTYEQIKAIHGKVNKLGKDRLKERRATGFNQGVFNVLVTVKALDEGFDVKDVDVCLTVAGKSVTRQNDQRNGRGLRYIEGKLAWMINIYVKDTKDYYWTKARQDNAKQANWIDDINQIGQPKDKVSLW